MLWPSPTPRRGGEVLSVGRDDIRTKLGEPGRVLLDVRSPEEYRGERVMPPPGFDHGAERAGRIPGSVHLFFRELLNADDTYKSTEELGKILSGAGPRPMMRSNSSSTDGLATGPVWSGSPCDICWAMKT